MLEIGQISKQFKDKKVLHDISLILRNGQITALVGSNGAGKSTLIGLMWGIIGKQLVKSRQAQ